MQRFTAKEVKPSPGENKPTIIKTEDGSSLSGFSASLKGMKAGTVFECDTEIKKGYVNVKGDPVIIQEGNGGQVAHFTEAGFKKEDPTKTASIETMNAITNIMTAYVGLKGQDPKAPHGEKCKLEELWERSLDWCDVRIPKIGQPLDAKQVESLMKGAPEKNGHEEVVLGPPFKNAGDFWTKAQKRWPNIKGQTEFVTVLEFNSARDLTNFDLAWDMLIKKLG